MTKWTYLIGTGLVTGSAKVTSSLPVSAVIRFNIFGVGIAGVGTSQVFTAAIALGAAVTV